MSGAPAAEQELLAIAHAAATAAAPELVSRYDAEPDGVRSKSTPTDPVSAADLAAEEAIRRILARERPGDAILGEEGGETDGDGASGGGHAAGLRWVVDPLDGTVNYLHRIPQFAVSIACEDADGGLVAVVLNPVTGETFAATRSGPSTLDGQPISASSCTELSLALVSTGFAYDPAVRSAQASVLLGLLPLVADIRRAGAAALDMCTCACGRVDAYYERGVKVWDIAAGWLICTRAGLEVRRLEPRGVLPEGVLVAPPALIDELHALVA